MPAYLGSEGVTLNAALEIQNDGTVLEKLIKRTISTYENPYLSEVENHAFYGCTSLTSVSLPQATLIGNYAFRNCSVLTSINLPQATSIGSNAFAYCNSLPLVELPQTTSIGSYAFQYCRSLTSVNLPQVTLIGHYAFYGCYSLASVNLPQATSIGIYTFGLCYNLLSLYLLGSSIPTLTNINVFTSTPISNYTTSTGGVYGSIYVPASLYNDYLVATNWSDFSSRIVSVGD